ncbi:hypothetical protein GQ55_1G126100 [Panicum hallii var. hallii]|uniref:Late embryogenesis abundant protein LEA-2 subgroup domain-containing protein n=1 Tax=Panicum hallii var. hallii TaxID=1504633 RepID=A0A2T7F4Y7_9POAL|nr:hypothetical protein GQ55_1G126100 [Panicum hallii var. hallii]
MAVRDGGKRTRFACLETARCMVAITVSAITVAVVVMVTIAALRPADSFSLSVVNGMDSSIPWSLLRDADAATNNTTMQRVAEKVNLTFALLAYNPSGRKDIRFGNFTIRVTDMPYFPSFTKMTDIAAFPVPAPFTLKRQGAHKLWSKFSLSDARTLSYVANTYGALGTFKAMVLVNASIGSGSGSGTPASNNVTVTYYCWPVLVGWTAFSDSPDGGVTCTPRKELSVDVDSLLPRSAPAPAAVYSRR